MKAIICVAINLLILGASCQNRQSNQGPDSQNPQVFTTSEEAVQKARRDLTTLLRNQALNIGVDAATVERAQPGRAVRQVMLDFDKLRQSAAAAPLNTVVKAERNALTPLRADNRIVTMVEVRRRGTGWSVAALGNQSATNDINAIAGADSATITLYEEPNLNIRVYGVRAANGTEQYYTNYKTFTLRQAVPLERLLQVLRADAQTFQRTYGDQLKKRRLVH